MKDIPRLLAMLVMAGAMTGLVSAADLSQHLWHQRVLLVFTPSVDDPHHTRLMRELAERSRDLDDRLVAVYRVVRESRPTSDHPAVSTVADEYLWHRFDVEPSQALLILIGMDGGEKLRSGLTEADLDRVFRRIDAMPMRRMELRGR